MISSERLLRISTNCWDGEAKSVSLDYFISSIEVNFGSSMVLYSDSYFLCGSYNGILLYYSSLLNGDGCLML
jgi:hypothetical protein